MSRQAARQALDQCNLRPAFIARRYAETPVFSDVTTVGMLGDLRELAAVGTVDAAAAMTRRVELAAHYGYPGTQQDQKPFVFVDGKAIIPVHGMLINRFSGSYSFATGYNFIRSQIEAAINDPEVLGIVYDVNTYGGLVAGCKETADAVYKASEKGGGKPSIAVVDANCYSAGYYCMSGVDRLVVTTSGGAGSIGVVVMHMDVSGALEQFGVKITFITAPEGGHKADGNMYEPLTEEVTADIQGEIDKMYGAFVSTVVRNRPGLSEEAVRATQARCYLADDALSLGLIDAIQTPPDALLAFFNAEEDDGSQDEDDPTAITQEDETMALATETKAAPAGPSAEQIASDTAAAASAARTAERERVRAIKALPEAEGRTKLADHLAMETDMDAKQAAAILAAAEKEAATPVVTTEGENHFKKAMDNGKHPNAGAGGDTSGDEAGGETSMTRAEEILAAQRRSTGYRAAQK